MSGAMGWVMCGALLAGAVAFGQAAPLELSGRLEDSHGRAIALEGFRGKPVILFYEDRDSTELNKATKDELFERGRKLGVLDRAEIVAVANLSPYDWFPARQFALAAVRDAEKKFGVRVLVDFRAALGREPWALPLKTSSILVFDGKGALLWRRSGKLERRRAGGAVHAPVLACSCLRERPRMARAEKKQEVAITGGTGLLGAPLIERLLHDGYGVKLLSRHPPKHLPPGVRGGHFDAYRPVDASVLSGIDAVIHLAGEPVSERWTPERKDRVLRSRTEGTSSISRACAEAGVKTLISASAVGYYGHRGDEPLTESAPPGGDFLARVCHAWEQATEEAEAAGVRVVKLRIGLVLATGGGALDKMLLAFKLGAGGPMGSGKQVWSWIHRDDVISLMMHALTHEQLRGPVNATAPNPVTQREFAHTLGEVLHRPSLVKTPAFALRLAMGEMADVVLTGQRVLPEKALASGFHFKYPELKPALESLVGKHR